MQMCVYSGANTGFYLGGGGREFFFGMQVWGGGGKCLGGPDNILWYFEVTPTKDKKFAKSGGGTETIYKVR